MVERCEIDVIPAAHKLLVLSMCIGFIFLPTFRVIYIYQRIAVTLATRLVAFYLNSNTNKGIAIMFSIYRITRGRTNSIYFL